MAPHPLRYSLSRTMNLDMVRFSHGLHFLSRTIHSLKSTFPPSGFHTSFKTMVRSSPDPKARKKKPDHLRLELSKY
jgi:hypothetical protein